MHTAALVLLLTKDRRLILQQRDNGPHTHNPGKISSFGGSVESGEQPVETAIREAHEELGLSLHEQDLRFWKIFHKTKARHGEDALVYLFVLRRPIDPTKLTVYEGIGYHLVSASDDLAAINLSPAAQDFVADFFANYVAD